MSIPMFCDKCGERSPQKPSTTNEPAHCPKCGSASWTTGPIELGKRENRTSDER